MRYLDTYPLARSAGVFLFIVGAAMVAGACSFRRRYQILGVGGFLAALSTASTAVALTAPHGAPSASQTRWLIASVLLEVVLLIVGIRRFAQHGDRRLTAFVLLVVAVHFIPMAPAFGPVLLLLGVACSANIAAALRWPGYSLPALWMTDGALKLFAGAVLWSTPRLPL